MSLARVHLTLHAYKCSAGSYCIWAFGHTILIYLSIICAQYSLRTSWACSNTFTILLVFARSRVFKLAGKTHYSKVGSNISTGLSSLAFTSSPVLAFTGKLPYSGSYLKTKLPDSDVSSNEFFWKHHCHRVRTFCSDFEQNGWSTFFVLPDNSEVSTSESIHIRSS